MSRAVASGVTELVTIGTRLSSSDLVVSVARDASARAKVWATVGVHPSHVDDEPMPTVDDLVRLAEAPEVVALGETGLDYVVGDVSRQTQREVFLRHIEASRICDVPVIIHARGADDDLAGVLCEEQRRSPFRFVLHCFSSSRQLASLGAKLGGYVSFSGILTFKRSDELRDIARSLPLDRLLIETDAPYLAPVPNRGRTNEPGFLIHTARALAAERGLPVGDLLRALNLNFRRLFRKAA